MGGDAGWRGGDNGCIGGECMYEGCGGGDVACIYAGWGGGDVACMYGFCSEGE